jgi:hypothetical protein
MGRAMDRGMERDEDSCRYIMYACIALEKRNNGRSRVINRGRGVHERLALVGKNLR